MQKWKIFTDGGCPANPGPGAFAFVIDKGNGDPKVTKSGFLPMATNNQAEYRAVNAAACFLSGMDTLPNHVEFWSDSKLIVNQLNGRYGVHDAGLRPFYEETKAAMHNLMKRTTITIDWFRRENNTEADELCNRVLARHGIEIVSKKPKKNKTSKSAALSQT